jgi:general secretion pathway protein B
MSYILDALRRADAERQQGQVPGLNAAARAAAAPETRPASRIVWVVLGAVLLVMLVTGWWWLRPVAAPVPMAAAPVTPAVPAAPPPPVAVPAPLPIVVSAPAPVVEAASAPVRPVVAASAAPVAIAAPRPLASLPPDQRRELPPLVLGGSVWSDNPTARFVMLDGQVLHEGDRLAPGLVLEKIERRGLTLRWRDQRIEVPL